MILSKIFYNLLFVLILSSIVLKFYSQHLTNIHPKSKNKVKIFIQNETRHGLISELQLYTLNFEML